MTLDEAAGRPVSRETEAKLDEYSAMVTAENAKQNLVASSTVETFRIRHILDSIQLLRVIPQGSRICDIGSGAGLPGVVFACADAGPTTLVEPRRLRAEFLKRVVDTLALAADVVCAKAESVRGQFDVITARAVAPLDRLLAMTAHLSHSTTVWVLPKGRKAQSELEVLQRNWHCEIGEVASVTDPEARIITLTNVRAKVGR